MLLDWEKNTDGKRRHCLPSCSCMTDQEDCLKITGPEVMIMLVLCHGLICTNPCSRSTLGGGQEV